MLVNTKAFNNGIDNLHECRLRKKDISSYPLKIYIEPTSACNLDCNYCIPQAYRVVEEMDMDMFYAIRDQLFDHCCEVNLFLRGEPTLAKNFSKMLDVCAQYPFITKFFSNLSYKNDPILRKMVESGSWINVSFDGVEVSKETRKGINMELVKRNIQFLVDYRDQVKNDKFHMRIAVVVSKANVKALQSIIKWSYDLGITEIMLGCLDAIHFENKNALTSDDAVCFEQAVKRCDEVGMRISTPSHIGGRALEKTNNWSDFTLPVDKYFPHFAEDCNPDVARKFCPYPWIQTVFEANGDVVSCCQRKITLGKFTPQTDFIKDIWNNDAYQKLRSKKNFKKCKDSWGKKCGIITYSIWGGECRLNHIPEKDSSSDLEINLEKCIN